MTAQGKPPGRPCQTCSHPRRPAIDRAILRGESDAAIAREFSLDANTVRRHRLKHVGPALALARERESAADPARYGDGLLGEVKKLHSACLEIMQEAWIAGEMRVMLDAIGRATKLLEVQGKILGQIDQPTIVVLDRDALVQKMEGLLLRLAPPQTIEAES